tara:strand:- start:2747 stop:3154 length:408 start_codon:yes stop_codon:yes gene_type:complete
MAMQYRFSVGSITAGSNALGIAQELSVSFDGDPQSFYGGDYRLPLTVELGNQSGEITARTARFDEQDDPLNNTFLAVTLGAGKNSGGLAGSFARTKVTGYEVASNQQEFVLSTITLTIADPDVTIDTSSAWPTWS